MLLQNLLAHRHVAHRDVCRTPAAAPLAPLSSPVRHPSQQPRIVQMKAQSTTNEDMSHRPFDTVDAELERERSESPSPMGSNASEQARKLTNTSVAVFSAQQYVKDFMKGPMRSVFPKTHFIEAKLDESTAKLAEGCEVVNIFVNDVCNKEVIKILANVEVKLISLRCAGFDRVDVEAANAVGIKVVRVPTYSPQSVAEHAVAHMFALNRNIANAHLRTAQGNYSLNGLVGFEMFRKTVGVIGTGAIGYEAIRILKGIGCNVLAYDVYQNPKVLDMGVEYRSLDNLLPECDIVTLHCPLLPTTYHLINRETIDKMKPGTMLVNVSRGGLVDTDAVFDGLENGHLGSVGLDVYEDEGDIFFVDHTMFNTKERMKNYNRKLNALLSYPQVLVTPHSAFLTNEALHNIATTTVNNITNWVLNEPLGRNEVEAPKKMTP
ncbi:putative D-lactate dehydrogenase [Dunaliella salina]|uniref:D-lactate dehydrogenase n=1 Tax=Dunaliella salina TaxID=3046 RepID=A0ABQ7GQB5_DUNSA|nr:putative D-lactate dehydrogenase [Dunaliella salina]|eukprot:KAF5836791.1 putative D-lactate dehydrogenase [Dunaliella salina]